MNFLRRNRYALLTIAVLFFSAVMVVQQFLANQSAHARMVEDFLLLHERGETKTCGHFYQLLVQQLPRISEQELVRDLQRAEMVVGDKTAQLDNLVWKYYVSVRNELRRRSEKRLEAVLREAGKE